MTDANLMDADCIHGNVWYDCTVCKQDLPGFEGYKLPENFEIKGYKDLQTGDKRTVVVDKNVFTLNLPENFEIKHTTLSNHCNDIWNPKKIKILVELDVEIKV